LQVASSLNKETKEDIFAEEMEMGQWVMGHGSRKMTHFYVCFANVQATLLQTEVVMPMMRL